MKTKFNPRILALFLIIVGTIWLSLYMSRPPAVVPASVADTEFSAERAMEQVYAISQEPHVTGSPEIYKVRDYILGELTKLGLSPEVQVTVAQSFLNEANVALAENILVKIPGTASSQAIMLMAHYDTVDNSHGAGDDGAGVAVMLETTRALIAGSRLNNDIILLFSDAEESTVAGAKAALAHPWLAELGLVLNLETRGSSGSVYMFETGYENGWIIPEFAKAVPYPATSSLMRDVYNNMPNNTDFTGFRNAGYAGFNISNLEGYTQYHSPLDTPEKLSPQTLQHLGSYALGIARHFGNLEMSNLKASDAVYFDLLGSTLIHYPGFLVIPLTILALLCFIGVVIFGWRKGEFSLKGIGQGFLAFLAVLVSGPGAVTLLWFIIRAVTNPPIINGDTYNSSLYFLGFSLLIVAITAALYHLFRRKASILYLAIGALFWWLILLVVTTIIFPMANFLFLWPLLFALIGVGDLLLTDNQKPLTWAGVFILSIAALPGLLMLPAGVYAIALGLLSLVSVTGVGLVLVSLLLGLMIPHLAVLTQWSESDSGFGQWWLSTGSGLLGVVVLIVAVITGRVDTTHPRLIHLVYGFDAQTGKAVWASMDSSGAWGTAFSEEWIAQFFSDQAEKKPLPEFYGSDWRQFTVDQAPVVALSPPEVAVLENVQEGDRRKLRLAVTSSRGATLVSFYIAPPAEVTAVAVNGQSLAVAENPPEREDMWGLNFYGPWASGMELSLEIKSLRAINILVVERVAGLPDIPSQSISPQPDYLLPYADTDFPSHVTLISDLLTFD